MLFMILLFLVSLVTLALKFVLTLERAQNLLNLFKLFTTRQLRQPGLGSSVSMESREQVNMSIRVSELTILKFECFWMSMINLELGLEIR